GGGGAFASSSSPPAPGVDGDGLSAGDDGRRSAKRLSALKCCAIDGSGAIEKSGAIAESGAIDGSGAIGAVSGSSGVCPRSEDGKTTTTRRRKRWTTRKNDGTGGAVGIGDFASPNPGVYARIGVLAGSGVSPGSAAGSRLFGEKENEIDTIPILSEEYVAVEGRLGRICAERTGEEEDEDAEMAFSVEKNEGMARRRPLGPVRRSVELGQLPASK
ncbi:unnamed protein product, partial [Laminaria digitata]